MRLALVRPPQRCNRDQTSGERWIEGLLRRNLKVGPSAKPIDSYRLNGAATNIRGMFLPSESAGDPRRPRNFDANGDIFVTKCGSNGYMKILNGLQDFSATPHLCHFKLEPSQHRKYKRLSELQTFWRPSRLFQRCH